MGGGVVGKRPTCVAAAHQRGQLSVQPYLGSQRHGPTHGTARENLRNDMGGTGTRNNEANLNESGPRFGAGTLFVTRFSPQNPSVLAQSGRMKIGKRDDM